MGKEEGNRAGIGRLFAGVVLLNALLAFPLLYLVYKHYHPAVAPWDIAAYLGLVDLGPATAEPPFRFRIITSALVEAMRFLPGYDIPIAFVGDAAAKKDFFHFILLNFGLNVLVSGLLFLYLRDKLRPAFAYLGSLLYLFSFYPVLVNLIPMVDAGCHLAVIAAILLMEKNRPVWFALVCLIGVFVKESALIVLVPWIAIQAFSDRRRLRYLAWTLPAALAFVAAHRIFPMESSQLFYRPGFIFGRLFHAFLPGQYNMSLVFHLFLAHAPLLAAFLAFGYLKWIRKAENLVLSPELFLFPLLIWLSFVLGLGNNTGRFIFMVFPVFIHFEAMVVQAVAERLLPVGRLDSRS